MRNLLRNTFLDFFGFFKNPKPGIHIMNAHYITANVINSNDADVFENFLKHLGKKSKLITIQEATKLVATKNFPQDESFLAFTFDDGYEECYETIAPLLEKYNCNAAFFINSNYVDSNEQYQKEYHKRVNLFTKKPMSWRQVESLHHRGHIIGSHSLDHYNLAILNKEDLLFQLTENKKILESQLNYNCEYFAWTYGKMEHFSDQALELVKKLHPYIFSGTNYKTYFSMGENVINRRHIEPFWSKNHIDYFLSVNKRLL
ncbi:polysaccharide deacetylase family protein [Chryseobacterium terrae]|uniref:Polysaccharide deacetylase family protein n=1 Tax=Chryseobacterium terrae TaxID=3163299 RepID=A0ABW8Y6R1_9FLAO